VNVLGFVNINLRWCDREQDYGTAWRYFEERVGKINVKNPTSNVVFSDIQAYNNIGG
jgi:hypothetical protein